MLKLKVAGLLSIWLVGIVGVSHFAKAELEEPPSSEVTTSPDNSSDDALSALIDGSQAPNYDDETYQEASLHSAGKKYKRKPTDWPKNKHCRNIKAKVAAIVGAGQLECYMQLFFMETGCTSGLPQKAGQANNPYAAYGLCSMEASAKIRAANNRGPDCVHNETFTQQVKCCRATMRKSPNYFGDYNKGILHQCH